MQTPTLALIVRREQDIQRFIPRDYFLVNADLGPLSATWQSPKKQSAIFDRQQAEQIAARVRDKEFRVYDVQITSKSTLPPLLYDLTELQRDANRLYQMSARETLSAMQRLYENHKALTYPRTDSRYLTDDIVPTLGNRLRAVAHGDFAPFVQEIQRQKRSISPGCVNNAKVSNHHAIIPTEQTVDPANMSTDERRIYQLVVKRFLCCFYPPYTYHQTIVSLTAQDERFTASGRTIVGMGWKKVDNLRDEEENNEQNLPAIERGDVILCRNIQLKSLQTVPPPRYTEATLLSAMENPSQFIDDKHMKEYIGGGLGTPATRADIIEKLFSAFYIEKRGTSLVPTSKGMQLIELVPEELREPLLTARWEQQLEQIASGRSLKDRFLQDIREYTTSLVKAVAASDKSYTHDNLTQTPCPVCGKNMLCVNSKKGKMLVCPDRECGHRQNMMMQTNTRCPVCHKRLELYGDGDRQSYVCRCGFREKVEKFRGRIGMGAGASKQFVKHYLQTQQQSVPNESSPFALALQKALSDESREKT